ncbi:MAG: hypothetical protein LBG61_06710 [Burkholderiales bacterium]|jgi:two-component system sensor histidine kinase PilS (NtrC family)|nr:hypothetical protein [Burkholderiales bacterium]
MFRSPDFFSVPLSATERRVLWIIAIYRGGYTLALLGSILLASAQRMGFQHSTIFVICVMLYFGFAMAQIFFSLSEEQYLPLRWALFCAISGDSIFLAAMMIAGDATLLTLPIFIFPQLAAHGWLLGRQLAWAHALIPTAMFITTTTFLYLKGSCETSQLLVTGLICVSYFFVIRIAIDIGYYTRASERLVQQRGIDIINLEQINRTVIRDMKDGVMILDVNGVVRGYNPQAVSLLDVAHVAASGQPLEKWNKSLSDTWRLWLTDNKTVMPPLSVVSSTSILIPRFVRIGSTTNGGTLVYLEDLGRSRVEAQNLKLAALGRLTASIAHEVRNPLSAIQQAAQLLEEDEGVTMEQVRLLGMIRSNGKRIDRIVTEILQLNRRDRRNAETIHLPDMLRSLVEEIIASEQMSPNVLSLSIDRSLENAHCSFDRGQLDQIIWNLSRNAWQFCRKSEGSIRILLLPGTDLEHARLDIVDDGPGIPDKVRERLFEPFFTTRSSGTGLGLYIARELAYANFADLELLPSSPDEGAHFRLRLRLTNARGAFRKT